MDKNELQQKALVEAIKHERCGIEIATGGGKTVLGLRYINHFYNDLIRILVAAAKLSTFEVWKDEIEKHNFGYLTDHIEYTTYLSLDNCSLDYDILICDEAHNLTDSCRSYLEAFRGRILGLSGTMPKYEHSEKGRLINEFCPVVFTYGVGEAVIDKILNDYRIIVHPLSLGTTKNFEVKGKGKSWFTSEKANYEYWTARVQNSRSKKEQQITRVMRMKALMSYKTKENYARVLFDSIQDKAILFANETAQVDRMASFTYHSNGRDNEENLELFKTGRIMKLGCVQMLSEGVNIPDLKEAVIMHSFSSSSPKSLQKLGRLLRLNPDEVATLHFLVYRDTIDAQWLDSILSDIDPIRITYK